jgi:protein TonB
MDSPRSGMRRARAVSWALTGLGIAGVAGTSTLAYADTFRPPATEVPTVAGDPAPPGTPGTGVIQSPETPRALEPDYTSRRTYETAPAPVTHESQPPTLPTTKRHTLTPATVMAPNFSPRISTSRGS